MFNYTEDLKLGELDEYFINYCNKYLDEGNKVENLDLSRILDMYNYMIENKISSPLARELTCLYRRCFK